MLYIFTGFPKNGLHAGGLQAAIEEVEELALLDHPPNVQYRKEGVFTITKVGEEVRRDVDYHMSSACLEAGITWEWFSENWSFGNGVTIHKPHASPEYRTVIHGTDLTIDQFLTLNGSARLINLELERQHIRHEGWGKYEARWISGTCPQERHIVHLRWLVTTHRLPRFAYQRIEGLIETGRNLKPCIDIARSLESTSQRYGYWTRNRPSEKDMLLRYVKGLSHTLVDQHFVQG